MPPVGSDVVTRTPDDRTAQPATEPEHERADWVSRLADEVIAEAERRGTKPVAASGISPSGPIHLGNFREVMSVLVRQWGASVAA